MTLKTLSLIAVFCLPLPALAQGAGMGEELFEHYCATCHGLDGKGGGPMAPVLLVQPSDLSTLQRRNEGTFPTLRVVKRIDGRDPLVSHGSGHARVGGFL